MRSMKQFVQSFGGQTRPSKDSEESPGSPGILNLSSTMILPSLKANAGYKSPYAERSPDVRVIRNANGQTFPLICNVPTKEPSSPAIKPQTPTQTRQKDTSRNTEYSTGNAKLLPSKAPLLLPSAKYDVHTEPDPTKKSTPPRFRTLIVNPKTLAGTGATVTLRNSMSPPKPPRAVMTPNSPKPTLTRQNASSDLRVRFDENVQQVTHTDKGTTKETKPLSRSLSHGAKPIKDDTEDDERKQRRLWSFSLPRFRKNSNAAKNDDDEIFVSGRSSTLPRSRSSDSSVNEGQKLFRAASLTSVHELESKNQSSASPPKSCLSQSDLRADDFTTTTVIVEADPVSGQKCKRQIVFQHTPPQQKHYVMPPRALRKYIKTNFRRLNLHDEIPCNETKQDKSQTMHADMTHAVEERIVKHEDIERRTDSESGISSGSSSNETESQTSSLDSTAIGARKPEEVDDTPKVIAMKLKPPRESPPSIPTSIQELDDEPQYINGIQYIEAKESPIAERLVDGASCNESLNSSFASDAAHVKGRRRRRSGSVSSCSTIRHRPRGLERNALYTDSRYLKRFIPKKKPGTAKNSHLKFGNSKRNTDRIRQLESEILVAERDLMVLKDKLLRNQSRHITSSQRSLHDTAGESKTQKVSSEMIVLREENALLREENEKLQSEVDELSARLHKLEVELIDRCDEATKDYAMQKTMHREELRVTREALSSLRQCFRHDDPHQHTLDTIEQSLSTLLERVQSNNSHSESQVSRKLNFDSTGDPRRQPIAQTPLPLREDEAGSTLCTKVIYYTEKSVTPFMSNIMKPLGEICLRDFKVIFDRPGQYRYHFKTFDPEFGMVKEEVLHDDAKLPGWDDKIVAWVEEDNDI